MKTKNEEWGMKKLPLLAYQNKFARVI